MEVKFLRHSIQAHIGEMLSSDVVVKGTKKWGQEDIFFFPQMGEIMIRSLGNTKI